MKNSTLLLIAILIASNPLFAQRKTKVDTNSAAQSRLLEVWNLIDDRYVVTPDMDSVSESAIVAMLSALDPHSSYIPAKDVKKANENLQGNFEGVGISFQILHDTIVIIEVIEGGPSEKARILPGDKIITINDLPATGDSVNNTFVSNHLRGPKGSSVKIGILRDDHTLSLNITRGNVPIKSADTYFMVNDTIGYLKLTRFARTSLDEVRFALKQLEKQGMRALIFDLRDNSGGYLDIATSLANEFLPSHKLIVYTQGRKQPRHSFTTNNRGHFREGNLVVLINENSASASEIVSGAIQDWDRGVIIGRRSFGKGLVQKLFTLKDGAQLRLTTARYFTPSGRCIQKPYSNGSDAYRNDIYERYKHGELLSQDSIHFTDSLMFKTASGRTIYGGGGIMPDIFVPIDTTKLTDHYLTLRKKGLINEFPLVWTLKHRNQFSSFDEFLAAYPSLDIDTQFNTYVESQNIEQPESTSTPSPEQIDHTQHYQHLVLKALIAKNLFGSKYYYQIMKEIDPCFEKAIQTLYNPTGSPILGSVK